MKVNDNIIDDPSTVNTHAESDAWFVQVEFNDDGELSELMEPDAYKEHCEAESN